MKVFDRAFGVSLFVFACILFGGGLLFRHSEVGTYASTAIALLVGPVLLVVLAARERRASGRRR
jgi:hypothetical protein